MQKVVFRSLVVSICATKVNGTTPATDRQKSLVALAQLVEDRAEFKMKKEWRVFERI